MGEDFKSVAGGEGKFGGVRRVRHAFSPTSTDGTSYPPAIFCSLLELSKTFVDGVEFIHDLIFIMMDVTCVSPIFLLGLLLNFQLPWSEQKFFVIGEALYFLH